MKLTPGTDCSSYIRIGDKVQIRRRGKRGTYVAEFFHHGQHRKRSLKTPRLDIARQRAIQLEAELVGGEYRPAPKLTPLPEAKADFLTTKRGEGLRPKSLVKYQDWLDAFIDFAATREVRHLERCSAQLFEDFRAQRQKTQSAKSMYTGMTIVKQVFKFFSGGSRDVLAANPVARCRVKKPYVAPKFTPTLEQVNAILAAAAGDRKLQYAVAAFSGVREEELAMLAPRSVDRAGGWIHVTGRDGWVPKTRQARKVPMHERLKAMLAEVPGGERPYYFCAPPSKRYPKGDHHLNVRQVNEDLQTLAKSLGIRFGRRNDGLVFHSLRHFFETACVDSGVPQFVIDAWMGHAGGSSMGKVYYGLTDAKSQDYMRQVKF